MLTQYTYTYHANVVGKECSLSPRTLYPVTNKCIKRQSSECEMSFEKIQSARLGMDGISDQLGWISS